MDRRTRYPQEVRERAVRMVFEHGPEYDSQYAAIRSIADKFGISAETLRLWRGGRVGLDSLIGFLGDEPLVVLLSCPSVV